jgi:hypothetical protein
VADIPEHILRRSAEARAKKEGRPVEEILAEMKGAPEEAASYQLPARRPNCRPPEAAEGVRLWRVRRCSLPSRRLAACPSR